MRTSICPLCEAACGILVDAENGQLRSIRGDPDDPFSRGYICPKAAALLDLHDDPNRVRTPLIREGTRWHKATWEDALDRAAEGLVRVRRRDGRDASAIYYGNPVAHNLGLMTHALTFARALRTRNVYSASSADPRSEERRVGKECRSGWSEVHEIRIASEVHNHEEVR